MTREEQNTQPGFLDSDAPRWSSHDLFVTTPEPLRSELRPLTRTWLLQRLAATRPHGRHDPELRGSLLALRSIARRVLQTNRRGTRARPARSKRSHEGSRHICSTNRGWTHAAAQLLLS
jgi:hypothetical protein